MKSDSVQNRFTAYVVSAVTNKKVYYIQKKRRVIEYEITGECLLEKKYVGFSDQLRNYKIERMMKTLKRWRETQEIASLIEDEYLLEILMGLRDRERKILFARVFGELSFEELAAELELTTKQAEMAYYYVIRKIRKALEKWKNEF